jgi:hypothetical protein
MVSFAFPLVQQGLGMLMIAAAVVTLAKSAWDHDAVADGTRENYRDR